jgi:hypothetical protein
MKINPVLYKYILYISFMLISISLSFAIDTGTSTGFGGLGIQISQDGDRILILGILPNTPADRANLIPGSVITTIDGEPVTGKTMDAVINKLRGEIGSPVKITVQLPNTEPGNSVSRELELTRDFIPIPISRPVIDTTVITQTIEPTSVRQTVTYYITTIPKPEQVRVGTPVIVRLMVDNSKGAVADRVAMQIQLDPEIFSCSSSMLDINSKFSTSWNKATTSINTATGKIYFELRAQSTDLYISGCIAELKLEPRRPVNETTIEYQFNEWGKYPNTVYLLKEKDLLGSEFDHKDGTMGIRFRINKE